MNPWTIDRKHIYGFTGKEQTISKSQSHQLCKEALNVNFMCRQYFWVLLVNIFHSVCPLHGNDRYCDKVILGHLSILFGKEKYVWGISIGTCFQYPINLT